MVTDNYNNKSIYIEQVLHLASYTYIYMHIIYLLSMHMYSSATLHIIILLYTVSVHGQSMHMHAYYMNVLKHVVYSAHVHT